MVSEVEDKIFKCIESKESFILDAGAGSGKTWTLIQTLNYLIKNKITELNTRNQRIVCITFTNVAKDEIIERTEHNELIAVSTIHDFLWDCVKNFQKELKNKLIEIIEEKKIREQEKIKNYTSRAVKSSEESEKRIIKYQEAITNLKTKKIRISYENFSKYIEGRFSHDDLVLITEKIFSCYPKIRKIITDSYLIILVDEYQDTQKETIQILLKYLIKNENFIVGFFGDKLQQIYDKGVGEISGEYSLRTIKKSENYRSSIEVINLLNKIRTDITQYQPPENTRSGEIKFYYQPNPINFSAEKFISNNLINKWALESKNDIKVLYLTHRFIAKENNYEEFYQINSRNNEIITKNSDNRGYNPYIDFLFDIEEIVELYNSKKIQQFLKKIIFKVESFETKKILLTIMNELLEIRMTKNIGEIIDFVIKKELLPKSHGMENYDFEDIGKKEFYDKLINIEYAQFVRLYQVQEEKTPYSTKHNTKGDEFDNVLVIIDDNAWKQNYNFNDFFSNNKQNEDRYKRTNNLFYVVCSRAKKNLAVIYVSDLSEVAKSKVKDWFGEENYMEVN